MSASVKPIISSYEAKLLYTLLDAAHDDGLLRGSPFETDWLAVRRQADSFPSIDRVNLYTLVERLDATRILDNTWMRERWLTVKRRVENAPLEFSSQPPFPFPQAN